MIKKLWQLNSIACHQTLHTESCILRDASWLTVLVLSASGRVLGLSQLRTAVEDQEEL